jgi:glycosyltransferase involved in cell wall biosynthesis
MSSSRTVSVVLPTHNRAHLLERAVRSVLTQTHADLELIIVDDGSTDETPRLAARLSLSDPRIRYIRNEKATGPAMARNTGITRVGASGYIAFLDDDDEWLPDKLERQLGVFASSPAPLSAVGCGLIGHEDDGSIVIQRPTYRGDVFEHLLARRARGYAAPLILVRRVPGKEDPLFDSDLPCLEDMDFSMRVALRGPVDFVADPLVKVYRNDGGPHVWNAEAAVTGYERLARKWETELRQRPWVRSYYDVCMARDLAKLGRMSECRVRLRHAVEGSSSRVRVWLWFVASIIGAEGVRACARLLPIRPPEVIISGAGNLQSAA